MENIPEEYKKCFLCEIDFELKDEIVEFFGGYAHSSCFDKQMKENAKRDKTN